MRGCFCRRSSGLAGESVEQISAAVLASAPATFARVGHGLGGDVALDVMRRAPDRVTRVGEFDTLVPMRRQEFTAGLMPYAKLLVIAGAGHLAPLEQPEAVTAALEAFLNGPVLLR